jgi:periodic tryptophan protein 2
MIKDLLVSGSWDKTVRTWELYSKKGHLDTFEHTNEVVSIDLTPNDKEISVSTLNGELYSIDLVDASIKSKEC